MPNATCFLIAYAIVFCLELSRWAGFAPRGKSWLTQLLIATTAVGLFTHSLYVLDRIFLSASAVQAWQMAFSWHDWGVLSAWALAVVYTFLLIRRSESLIGLFVLPMLLILIGGSILLPSQPIRQASSARLWGLSHGIAMMLGTMLVSLGFAMSLMYLVQEWRLRSKRPNTGFLRLPSLEYLQSFGSLCLLTSTAAIGFGFVSGVIMNLVQAGTVNWTDIGILISSSLFLWLLIASVLQWYYAKRGLGHITAWMNILSFAILSVAVLLLVSAPHGRAGAIDESIVAPALANPTPANPAPAHTVRGER